MAHPPVARPWYRARWIRLTGVILLLLVLGAAAIPFLVPVDRARPLLVRLLSESTGRDVRVGVLRLYLVPTVHIHGGDLSLKNPQGFPPGDAMSVRSVDLGLVPRALLSRRLAVTHVAFSGVRLNLLSDPAGRTNFVFSPPSREAAAGKTAGTSGGGSFLTLDRIGTVTIRNVEITSGSLDARGGQVAPTFRLHGVNARIESIDLSAPAWARALRVTVNLRGAQVTTPALAQPVRVSTGGITLEGLAAHASFSASLDGVRADVTAGAARVDRWPITFTISIPELDVARLQTLVRNAPPGGGTGGADRQAAPPGQQLLATGDLNVGRLIRPPLSATRLTGRLRLYTGAIHVASYVLTAYGGTIQGAAAVDSSTARLPAAITAKVSGVDLGQIAGVVSPSSRKITGRLEGALKLSTAFGRDPLVSLAGAGSFAVRNGSFPGLDLKSALAQLARALQLTVPAGPTKFSYFGGDVRISQERVYSGSLRLEAEGLEGTATGSAGFDRTLDYTGTGVLKTAPGGTTPPAGGISSVGQMLGGLLPGTAGATGVRVPFSLRGTVEDPKFSLAGAPQFLHGPSPQPTQPQAQPPGQPSPGLPDLLKLFQ
jgi:AsmA family/AsmA-like C-terminal region